MDMRSWHCCIGPKRMTSIKESFKKVHIALVFYLAVSGPVLFAQGQVPDWCRALPRLEYKRLQRVPVSDSWFEVFEVAPAVFALYEPHQAEETIGYLIVGDKRAVLFDTGMGISDIRQVTAALTKLPIVVLNSHTHNDHVGGNWQFATIYAMDTDFTRANARVRAKTRNPKSRPIRFAVSCQRDLTERRTRPGPGRLRPMFMTVIASIWAAGHWRSSPPQATRPTRSLSLMGITACFLPATPIIRALSGSTARKLILKPTVPRFGDLPRWRRGSKWSSAPTTFPLRRRPYFPTS
jgi:hypothetical protein